MANCDFKGESPCKRPAGLRADLKRYMCDYHYNLETRILEFDSYAKEELEFIITSVYRKLADIAKREHATTFKYCDKCSRSYPYLTSECLQCQGQLREFEVPFSFNFD